MSRIILRIIYNHLNLLKCLPKNSHLPHLAPDTAPTTEAFAALVSNIIRTTASREPRPVPPLIPTSAIAGWWLTRIFDAVLLTSKLVVKLQCQNFLHHMDGLNF